MPRRTARPPVFDFSCGYVMLATPDLGPGLRFKLSGPACRTGAPESELVMSEGKPPRRIGRSIVALFAGFVVVVVLSLGTDIVLHATGVYPPWFQPMSGALFLLATVYRTIYSVAGSYVTARLAPYRPMTHALVGGAIGLVLSTAGAVATWNRGPEFGPHWYPVALIVLALPCAWAGGKVHSLQTAIRAA
jgi:hypothetical protein